MEKITENKLPLSAMVVGHNEANLLKDCLSSISFCDEILYADLQSSDSSVLIAQDYQAKIYFFNIQEIPSCEFAQAELVKYTKHDWVLFIDPDERVDRSLASELIEQFKGIASQPLTGAIMVPWQFYFKQYKLKGTVWGGSNQKFLIVNKHRFEFNKIVHYGRTLKEGFDFLSLPINNNGNNLLHHYWVRDWWSFLKKHQRYLKQEAIDQFNFGKRMNLAGLWTLPFRAFRFSYHTKQGYKDRWLGLLLSLFWVYYKTIIGIKLYVLTRKAHLKLD